MSETEKCPMESWVCPNCGNPNFKIPLTLDTCGWCGYKEKALKGIAYQSEYMTKCVDDVIKFNEDHGVDEHRPDMSNMVYHALCLAGEAGEVANVVKKIWRDGDSPALRAHLAEEIVDLTIFLGLLIASGEIDFDKAWIEKHEELYRRWADKKISRRTIHLVHVKKNQAVVELDMSPPFSSDNE